MAPRNHLWGQNFDQVVRDTVTPLISRVDNELLPTLDFSSEIFADEMTEQRFRLLGHSVRTCAWVFEHLLLALRAIGFGSRDPIIKGHAALLPDS
jgi:hypothetical protein